MKLFKRKKKDAKVESFISIGNTSTSTSGNTTVDFFLEGTDVGTEVPTTQMATVLFTEISPKRWAWSVSDAGWKFDMYGESESYQKANQAVMEQIRMVCDRNNLVARRAGLLVQIDERKTRRRRKRATN